MGGPDTFCDVRTRWASIAAFTVSVLVSGAMVTGCAAVGSSTTDTTGTGTPASSASPADARCGGSVDTLDGALKVITGPIGCPGSVNTFWSQQLGSVWTTPKFFPYRDGQVPPDACGAQDQNADDFQENAFYCRLDDTVAYSSDFLGALYAKGGAPYPMFVLMHELGHRATFLSHRTGAVSRSEENQADCLAGAETKFAHDAGRLPLGDALKGAELFFTLGDAGGAWFRNEPSTTADAHGTPAQRFEAFSAGYLKGVNACYSIGQSPDGRLPSLTSLLGV
jgi:predicted metalloprotease